jgi:hypothetical protein
MDLERIAVALRPRGNFEAMDLGFRMAARWWRPLWGTWLLLYLPFAIALHFALPDDPYWAVVVAWWCKPLFERFVLHVVSRRVFGEEAGVLSALANWREVLSPGLFGDLTWRRPFAFTRSFGMPVTQLERSRGAVARERRRVLGNRTSAHALALTWVCACFEMVVFVGLAFLVEVMLRPEEGEELAAGTTPLDFAAWWTHGDSAYYLVAISLVAPFYVAAGFALYLNRRVGLEAWDVELSLRRLQQRLARAAGLAGLAVGALLALAPSAPALADNPQREAAVAAPAAPAPGDATGVDDAPSAQPATTPDEGAPAAEAESDGPAATTAAPAADPAPRDDPAGRAARELFADPVFGSQRDVERWRWRNAKDEPEDDPDRPDLGWLDGILEAFATVVQFAGWIAIAAVVVALVVVLLRVTGSLQPRVARSAPPTALFGLEIAPESLPPDVGAAALAACQAGDARAALSLLYRGALSTLVHRHAVDIPAGAVEADVLQRSRTVLAPDAVAWLDRLLAQWIAVAWARSAPDLGAVAALASGYGRLVADPVPAAAPPSEGLPA